uniref:RING-type domain-containing protein n=1 Tax=Heterorhabditis bacteriophora TaxID=37862 RepID=A0A1I7XS93_HETBA
MDVIEFSYMEDGGPQFVCVGDANLPNWLDDKTNTIYIIFPRGADKVPPFGLISIYADDIRNTSINKIEESYARLCFPNTVQPPDWLSGSIKPGDFIKMELMFRKSEMSCRIALNHSEWSPRLVTAIGTAKIRLLIETAKKNILILRDDLYCDYVLNGAYRHQVSCAVCFEDAAEVVTLQCGHLMCCNCQKKWRKSDEECHICKAKGLLYFQFFVCTKASPYHPKIVTMQIKARYRDGPCPFDYCRPSDQEKKQDNSQFYYIMVPCGCTTRCDPHSWSFNGICPFDACGMKVTNVWKVFET